MSETVTLGSALRGYRLGYGWLPEVHAYVRVSPTAGPHLLVRVRSGAALPTKAEKDTHYAWYTEEARRREPSTALLLGEAVRRILAGATSVRRVRRPVDFLMDDEGNPVPVS